MTEQTDLARRVATQLDTPIDPSLPEPLDRVSRYRSAAYDIAEDDVADSATKTYLIAALVDTARKAAEMHDWYIRAIWEATAGFLTGHHPNPPPSTPWQWRQRQLRRAGYQECPLCRSHIASEATLKRVERLQRDAVRDTEVRARAARR